MHEVLKDVLLSVMMGVIAGGIIFFLTRRAVKRLGR